jgi:hydroxyacylglutathione hydrolase
MVTDTAGADKPMGVFTGDFLFVGDVGRPDLLEEAAGMSGTKEVGARQQYASVERFKDLPDYLQIWPAHGAGSACGKALGAIPSTTLGYEKLFNPAFQHDTEDAFVDWLLEGQPEAPYYFAQMKKVNKLGPELLDNLPTPLPAGRGKLDEVVADPDAVVVDFRDADAFSQAYVPGTMNIPASSDGYVNYVGWFVDYDAPFYFVAPEGADVDDIVTVLRSIGVDNTPLYFEADVVNEGETASLTEVDTNELAERAQRNGMMILDVRGATEYSERHIVGATNIPLGYITRELERIPQDKPVVTHCASGYRSQIAASVLRRHGFNNVSALNADTEDWSKALPTE